MVPAHSGFLAAVTTAVVDYDLSAHLGKVVVIALAATWCVNVVVSVGLLQE